MPLSVCKALHVLCKISGFKPKFDAEASIISFRFAQNCNMEINRKAGKKFGR